MAIELILMDNVEKLGEIGEKVRVSDGYARNFLIPNGLAVQISKAALKQLEARKLLLKKKYEEDVLFAQEKANQINDTSITIPMQASEDEKLYGSVSANDIVKVLNEDGIEVDKNDVILEEPIRQLGVYDVEISLHAEVSASLKVWVVKA